MGVKKNRRESSRQLDLNIARKMEASGILIASKVKALAPVDTGRLRLSYEHEVEGDTLRVGTRVTYAKFQEFGTRHQPAQPHLVPGVNASRGALRNIWGA